LVKTVEGALAPQVDVSGNILISNNLGLAWRWSAAVSAMAGFQISDGFVGYGYDLESTNYDDIIQVHENISCFKIEQKNQPRCITLSSSITNTDMKENHMALFIAPNNITRLPLKKYK
jgi:hypothetical protein